MLRDGVVAGKEDLALLYRILRKDFVLPIWPSWDEAGQIIGPIVEKGTADFNYRAATAYKKGIFNPRQWGISVEDAKGAAELQKQLKIHIARRLMPGWRRLPADEFKEDFERFYEKKDPLSETGAIEKIDNQNSPWSLWKALTKA
eukprot:TRINITY_DN3227_c0_g1_i2.p1 TRINITY_DN3227_c0_g1~~TRINITY_DN3227_c0_g1_i2.p1  ORF type:complete len:145 (+),score=28.53 TRINITY_DN3227_c0_g1_i2:441-875(+)